MTEPERLRISDQERHQVAEILRTAAGEGRLDLEELDERLEATYAAKTYADLVPITHDLPGRLAAPAAGGLERRGGAAPEPSGGEERHLAILSGVDRKGAWRVPERLAVTAFMGGADLDLREATFSAREVVFTINAVMGGASITVPPEVEVVMEGTGIMGAFTGPSGLVGADLREDSPVLRVRGVAIMGGVDVKRKHRKGRDRRRRRELD